MLIVPVPPIISPNDNYARERGASFVFPYCPPEEAFIWPIGTTAAALSETRAQTVNAACHSDTKFK